MYDAGVKFGGSFDQASSGQDLSGSIEQEKIFAQKQELFNKCQPASMSGISIASRLVERKRATQR